MASCWTCLAGGPAERQAALDGVTPRELDNTFARLASANNDGEPWAILGGVMMRPEEGNGGGTRESVGLAWASVNRVGMRNAI